LITEDDSIFGPPPILKDEDPRAYAALLANVSRTVRPKDFLEKIWVRDAVDLTWEIFRWRKLMKDMLSSKLLSYCIDNVEKIDRLTMLAEARRNSALREIEHHRTIFARNLRQTIEETDSPEYQLIEQKSATETPVQKNIA
jgi:hypothetical protein